ncbi:transposase family protein [Streptomyces sp. NPDC001507]|uniref:transposase family protein n=1 Tax=Streptomyces sp. NPDC001507 TaxID=3364579 RepID=UPI0036B805E5
MLFKGFEVLVTTAVHGASETVVRLSVRREAGSCPTCGRASTRVPDRYERRLPDLPLARHGVRILLSVRRLICVDGSCPQRTFAEQTTGEPFLAWTGGECRADGADPGPELLPVADDDCVLCEATRSAGRSLDIGDRWMARSIWPGRVNSDWSPSTPASPCFWRTGAHQSHVMECAHRASTERVPSGVPESDLSRPSAGAF